MDSERLGNELERIRPDLRDYLRRYIGTSDAADDILQNTALRAISAIEQAPEAIAEIRPWLFRIATNLALDEIRRRARWNPEVLFQSRPRAEQDADFVAMSNALRGSSETKLIAREHLAACFACTLRNLRPEHAAALLLREVYGFTIDEIASIVDARPAQVKNWLQDARRTMEAHYESRCALVKKEGICYQCSELADFFNGQPENPLAGARDSFETRLRIVSELRGRDDNPWHQRLFAIFDDL